MDTKTKKIKTNSPKKNMNKSIDKYREFLGDKKDIKNSKDKKVFHVTRKRVSPKKIKKINNPRDLLQIENEISKMKSKDSNSIQMPTQNMNLTSELNKSAKPVQEKTLVKPVTKSVAKSVEKPDQGKTVTKIVTKSAAKPDQRKTATKSVVKPVANRSTKRPISRSTNRNKRHSKNKNKKVSVKTGVFRDKDIKNVESKIKEIRKKKTEDIKKELESQGVRVSGKSNRLIRDIYLYSKISNINIKHEV